MISSKYVVSQILVSPATAGINVAWMDEFMQVTLLVIQKMYLKKNFKTKYLHFKTMFQICEELGCRIDYIATHAYPMGQCSFHSHSV